MGFRAGSYLTIWEVTPGERSTMVRASSSRKDKNTGEYETDWSGFVRLIGEANTLGAGLRERDRIRIGECEVTTRYIKEKQKEYTNYTIFSFTPADSGGSSRPERVDEAVDMDDDGELPF